MMFVMKSRKMISAERKRQMKKGQVPDYGIQAKDGAPDMKLGDLFDEPVLPQDEKQIALKPPSYEDMFSSDKGFYVDPQYFKEQPDQLPPEYDEDEVPDYEINKEDLNNQILNK
ncbi:hypothetical protein AWC38_SpisGene19731 [Stylophora pistillata]|uniref:Uncharacterized protein n=1 Tax=Stylophora pistillata TaxID=50429 RepID=A0A2B4RFS7_STYPI|nr:hypothetical protein AWC38_SpisGene19731 [Stylophora pistillata]